MRMQKSLCSAFKWFAGFGLGEVIRQFCGETLKHAFYSAVVDNIEEAIGLKAAHMIAVALSHIIPIGIGVAIVLAIWHVAFREGRKSNVDVTSTANGYAIHSVEFLCRSEPPYEITSISNGQINRSLRIGIKNTGRSAISNCRVYVDKISPPTNMAGGDTLQIDGTGFTLRPGDPEKLIDVANKWGHSKTYRFSFISGGFHDSNSDLNPEVDRFFNIKLVSSEITVAALFKICKDRNEDALRIVFLNYVS